MKINKIKMAYDKGYRVDNLGNTSSIHRAINPTRGNRGYFVFGVKDHGKMYMIPVHRLQAYQKYGDVIFNNGIVVRHKDGDSTNNSIQNILIGSQSVNILDIPLELRMLNAVNAASKRRRFTDEEVSAIVSDRNSGLKYCDLVIKYNTSKSTLSYLLNSAYYNKKAVPGRLELRTAS